MLDLKNIQEYTNLPDKIIINDNTAFLSFIQLPEDYVSLGYYYKLGEATMAGYVCKRQCKNDVDLFDLIIDFEEYIKPILNGEEL